jgi:ATP-dependent exoDNAse (exonuclease V) beta subunit
VGDRKQSIYGFRDADVAVIDEAGEFIDNLRPDRDSRRAISRSFRAVPHLLAFANDVFDGVEKLDTRRDAFRFREQDRFPVETPVPSEEVLGIVAGRTVSECADAVAAEIRRLLDSAETVRDPATLVPRPIGLQDIAILFRTRESHQEYEKALERQQIPSYVYRGLGFFDADEIKDVMALLRYLAMPDSDARTAAFLRSRFIRLSDPGLQALAPDLAVALVEPSASENFLAAEDQRVLRHARPSIARWLALVDRVPPAELLDLILGETAYLFETRGPRVRQARENLKKMRAMIRRVQNRGYTTMARLAQHLEQLSAGDESNAVIDAGDAVSLMTIHAAKGLEFPVVFAVNLGKGTGTRRPAIRVVADDEAEKAWLSVGDFLSEADEDARAKDREETKRLLYVALTRARDRLYLGHDLKEGRFRPFGGSLADVLPLSLGACFEMALASPRPLSIDWNGPSGDTHSFRVCAPPADLMFTQGSTAVAVHLPGYLRDQRDHFQPLVDPFEVPRVAVTAAVSTARSAPWRSQPDFALRNLTGALVHALLERFGMSLAATGKAAVQSAALRLLSDDELSESSDPDELIGEVAEAYLALCANKDLRLALEAGEAEFELPFSARVGPGETILRGTFDCLVRSRDGVTVLEFKTGKPSRDHETQLAIYLAAARALFPGKPVEGRLIYAS